MGFGQRLALDACQVGVVAGDGGRDDGGSDGNDVISRATSLVLPLSAVASRPLLLPRSVIVGTTAHG